MNWLALFEPTREGSLTLAAGPRASVRIAEENGCTLLFSGALAPKVLRDDQGAGRDDARLLAEYLCHGPKLFPRLRGRFALVLLDRPRGVCFALRDPMGAHPLFYARDGEALYLSPSAETAARRAGRLPELDRMTAAAFLLRTSFEPEETFFAGVRRLLQGHVLEARAGLVSIERYWLPSDEPAPYDPERFHLLVRQAVERQIDGPAAIFLSGGLDSALVAAVLADTSASRGMPPPLALSLAFRDSDADEEATQRLVASRLGLEHFVQSPSDLAPDGLLAAALAVARVAARPPELLVPAYDALARRATAETRTTIFSGTGGDEVLLPPPGFAVDRIAALDVVALARLSRAWAGYWPGRQPLAAIRGVFWRSGLRRAARTLGKAAGGRYAPGATSGKMRERAERLIPAWVAPDQELRRSLLERLSADSAPARLRGVADAEKRAALDAEYFSSAQETSIELQERTGAVALSPLLDPDVVEFLYRVPTAALITGGRAKAPARDVLARYLGALADGWPRTVYANSIWTTTIRREGARAWAEARSHLSLSEQGLVDPIRLGRVFESGETPPTDAELSTAWRALSLDAWLRGLEARKNHL